MPVKPPRMCQTCQHFMTKRKQYIDKALQSYPWYNKDISDNLEYKFGRCLKFHWLYAPVTTCYNRCRSWALSEEYYSELDNLVGRVIRNDWKTPREELEKKVAEIFAESLKFVDGEQFEAIVSGYLEALLHKLWKEKEDS